MNWLSTSLLTKNVWPLISSKDFKRNHKSQYQAMNIRIKQRNAVAHNELLNHLTERRGSSTMLATSGLLGMKLRYPQTCSIIIWLTQFFHSAKNFPSAIALSVKQYNVYIRSH